MFFKNIKLYNYKNIGKNQSKPCNHSYCIRSTGRLVGLGNGHSTIWIQCASDVTEYHLAYPDLA